VRDGAAYGLLLAGNVYNEVSRMRLWSEPISDVQIRLFTVGVRNFVKGRKRARVGVASK